MDLQTLFATILTPAREIVMEAGNFIRTERQTFHHSRVEYKGMNDLFSYVDTTAERLLTEKLADLIPGCGFINEESGIQVPENEFTWIIDPLDGTTNFIHDLPVYSVSVALQRGDQIVLGFVYDIVHQDLYEARLGEGAFRNHQSIRISDKTELHSCLMATGFPQKSNFLDRSVEGYIHVMKTLFLKTRGLRRMGSAAIDLAYTACGRFDGFFEMHLKPWDVSAGILLVTEAGGIVSDFRGDNQGIYQDSYLAANPTVHRLILEELGQWDF
jgi:myo-inositol-1(or 4)-monophosphatase